MDVNHVLQSISEKQKRLASTLDVERNIDIDVGSLSIWDPDAILLPKAGKEREEYFLKIARDDVQTILNKLYVSEDLETREGSKFLKLPPPSTILPRAKMIPQPKAPTKWERFAKSKGIKPKSSNRREKQSWDDNASKWIPRYGYKRAEHEEQKDWLIEIPDNGDPNVDYFAKRNEEKKERVAKNKFQQLRNIARVKGVDTHSNKQSNKRSR